MSASVSNRSRRNKRSTGDLLAASRYRNERRCGCKRDPSYESVLPLWRRKVPVDLLTVRPLSSTTVASPNET